MSDSPFIVSVEWLHAHLEDEDLSIVDASWYLPAMERDGKAEYEVGHIPGAVFFDIDAMSEPGSPLPHTLASPEHFAEEVGKLGISDQDIIVVYDGAGLFSAARAWWNFRIMGATKVVILDGGFPAWVDAGYPVESGSKPISPTIFDAKIDKYAVTGFAIMKDRVKTGSWQIADARPLGRFTGEEAEPRAGMRSGHMPGACSVPTMELSHNGKLKSKQELKSIFENAGIDLTNPIVTTCGSGVTAAILTLALETIGNTQTSLYDGSWSEWGGRDDTEIATGTS